MKEMLFKDYYVFNPVGHLVQHRGPFNDHSCEVLSKSAKELWRRCRLKLLSIFSHFVQQSGIIWAIAVEGHQMIIPVKFDQNRPNGNKRQCRLKNFFSIFSPGSHLVQRSGTIWANLVEGYLTIIPVKFYRNPHSDSGGDDV